VYHQIPAAFTSGVVRRVRSALSLFLLLAVYTSQAACGPSPNSALKEYVSGLQNDDLAAFWQYSTLYNSELDSALDRLPRDSWENERQRLQRKWTAQISADRKSALSRQATWTIIRAGANTEVTEVRAEQSNAGSPNQSWKGFLKMSYATEDASPVVFLRGSPRRLRSATAVLEVLRQADAPKHSLRVADDISFLTETVVVWPAPPLSTTVALELAKGMIREGSQPWIEVDRWPAWNLPIWQGFTRTKNKETTATVEAIKKILERYGFSLNNLHDYSGYYEVDEIVPPRSWAKYALSTRTLSMGHYPLPVYALAEQVNWDIVSVSHPSETQAIAEVRLTYTGCTPICSMVKELRSLPIASGRLIFRNYSGADWSMTSTAHVFYQWRLDEGWKATGAQ
jgi:hypothetical protein